MQSMVDRIYTPYLEKMGFYIDSQTAERPGAGTYFILSPEMGTGSFWIYAFEDLFFISIMDFCFSQDVLMEYPQFAFINLCYYESVFEERLEPHDILTGAYLRGYIGTEMTYKSIIHKNVPMRSISINLMPAYYDHYLRTRYPGEYEILHGALSNIHGIVNIPELTLLFKQIKAYRASGLAATLYYESKIAQAISIIVQNLQKESQLNIKNSFSEQDLTGLSSVLAFIDNHYDGNEIRLDHLSKLACMSTSKLKYAFKQTYNCTISEYINSKRMERARYLLANTQLDIAQIARLVGYKKPGSFSESFRNATGFLPNWYRKQHML